MTVRNRLQKHVHLNTRFENIRHLVWIYGTLQRQVGARNEKYARTEHEAEREK